MRGVLRSLAGLLALLVLATVAFAAAPTAGEDFYVLDQANVLSAGTKAAILERNQHLYKTYGIQIVVVTVQDLADQNIQDYTRAIVNEWKVGGGDRLGMVLVLDIQGEDYYCVSGTGISEKFSTKVLQELLDQYLEPQFAQGSYDGAVAGFFAEAADRAESWGAEGAFGTKTTQSTAAGEPNWAGLAWIALGLVLIAVSGWKLLAFFKKRRAKA